MYWPSLFSWAFDLFDLQPLKLQNRRGELQPLGLTERWPHRNGDKSESTRFAAVLMRLIEPSMNR